MRITASLLLLLCATGPGCKKLERALDQANTESQVVMDDTLSLDEGHWEFVRIPGFSLTPPTGSLTELEVDVSVLRGPSVDVLVMFDSDFDAFKKDKRSQYLTNLSGRHVRSLRRRDSVGLLPESLVVVIRNPRKSLIFTEIATVSARVTVWRQ